MRMLDDSVLRCLVPVRFQGEINEQVFEAIREGENYLVVLEWATSDEGEGRVPKQCVLIPATEFHIEPDPLMHYELVSSTGIDLDAASTTDVASVTARVFQFPPRK